MSAQLSGQITVTTAGTEIQGSNIWLPKGAVAIKALAANTGKMYVGNNGDDTVASTTGYELAAGEAIILAVENLAQVWVDASVNGEKVCWAVV